MRTEVSSKFRLAKLAEELAGVGLHVEHWMTDMAADYAVSLSVLRDPVRDSAGREYF
jgi:uncharacterized SAM-dependent methyltransferase